MSGGNQQNVNPQPQAAAPPAGYSQQPPQYPYGVPGQPPANSGFAKPNRGGMLLAFGICGLLVCPVFGVVAFAMSKKDLREMRAGVMDPSGEGLTKAGYYLGMVSMFATLALILIYVALFIVMYNMGVFDPPRRNTAGAAICAPPSSRV